MDLITVFVLAIGLSMDSFAVAISCGLAEQKVTFGHAVKISFAFAFFQGVLPLLGWFMGTELKIFVEGIDHWIAFSLLTYLGGKMIYESFREGMEDKIS
jgi:putative Mn2+ efflux pump MntP